jgi:DNA gyrase subunit A
MDNIEGPTPPPATPPAAPPPANIGLRIPVAIEEEMKSSFMDYAMSVIVARALPDARDGLKPVHRRILYTQHLMNNLWNRPYIKCARVVGDVLGKFHPHGDSACYDALVRLAQDFSMRYPLIDGQGNFGSVDGDPAAAYRYTECRMEKIGQELLADIDKQTVEFQPNYDDKETEPTVLPTRLPNLLINGASGIAVGMATNIPPHNLREIVDATIAVIRNPDIEVDDLIEIVPGPDFPTAGIICGRNGIRQAYETGRGSILVRARTSVEEHPKSGRKSIVATEIPYQVNKAKLIEKIAELVREKKIDGISDVRDESDREGMRVVVDLKKDAVPEVVLNNLWKMTPLQESFGINCLAIVDGRPQTLSLKQALQQFIQHRRDVVTRRTQFDLQQAQARMHILEGLKIAVDNIDAVIDLIRSSKDTETAKAGLIETFDLSAIQAQEILNMRLSKLTGLERDKLLAEIKETAALIASLEAILASDAVLVGVVVSELEEVKKLLRRRPAHRDRGHRCRHQHRGHDRPGGYGGDGHPRRLRQTQSAGAVPGAATRWARHHRRQHPRGGLRVPALRGVDPRHPIDVHQQGAGLRPQDLGNPAGGSNRQGQGLREPDSFARRRAGGGLAAGARVLRGRVRGHGHHARPDQEDLAAGLCQYPFVGDHRAHHPG